MTPPRALWLWDPSPLLAEARARRDFLDFCERHDIGVVWAQIGTRGAGADRRLERAAEWKALLAEAHGRGITVDALDGDPQYARRARHDAMLSVVDAVIAYNASAGTAERFDGVHFDNEPYLLPEWREPRLRERLLADYLDLNQRAAARSHAAGLAYGVDIPFWWPATERLLGLADTVAVMDYRTAAAGPDGIIGHALPTIERADTSAKARVFVGVETGDTGESATAPSKVTFAGRPPADIDAELAASETAFAGHRSYAGMAIHDYRSFRQLVETPIR